MTRTAARRTAPGGTTAADEIPDEVIQALQDLDDPDAVGELVEVGPGVYRAPLLARQLAETVAAYRAARGLSREQLGRLIGLHESQIARLEAGLHTPDVETLVRLSRHLRITFSVTVTPEGASLASATNGASA